MARHKLSYGVFDGNGGANFFNAMADPTGPISRDCLCGPENNSCAMNVLAICGRFLCVLGF